MIVERIAVENFMSYRRRCEVELSGKRTVGIVGSNEAGKSTLLQAISYALYGRTNAERESQLLTDGAKENMIVEVALRFPDESLLEITRGRTPNNEPILKASGFSGKPSAVHELILERLGLDYEDFVSLAYFKQGDIHQFMTGNKRAYFQRWASSLSLWQHYESATNVKIADDQTDLSTLRSDIERSEDVLADADEIKARGKSSKAAMHKAQSKIDLLTEQVAKLRSALAAAQKADELTAAIRDLKRQHNDLANQVHRAERSVASARSDLKRIAGARCPLLNIHCDELEAQSSVHRTEAKAKLKDAEDAASDLAKQELAAGASLKKLLKERRTTDIDKIKNDLENTQHDLTDANRVLRRAAQEYGAAKSQWEGVQKARAKLGEMKKQVATLEERIRRFSFVRYMVGKSGIPAMLIESELERVESRCNWVLDRLDYPKRIRFSGFKELQAFERVCPVCGAEDWHKQKCRSCDNPRPRKRKDEPTVTVLDGNSERPFQLESGGARVLQSFAVRLACSLFVSSMTGIPMRLAMLDEVFAMLDADNRQKLMSLVIDKLSSEFGLQQQLVVSHHDDILNAVDDLLVVRREHGSAVAQWA